MSSPNATSDRPLIVISLDGFARSALGCYGSSWNRTPAMDAIAASGCVWDRAIAPADDPRSVLRSWFDASGQWAESWRAKGSLELLTDCDRLDHHDTACFDRVAELPVSDPSSTDCPVDELVETQFGQLIAAAIERDAEEKPWSVLWIHSSFLTRRWDAPRDLIPTDELDLEPLESAQERMEVAPESEHDTDEVTVGEANVFAAEDGSGGDARQTDAGAQATAGIDELDRELPPIFDTVVPPAIQLALEEPLHPDLITSWMRTYGCQIRLVDLLIEVLLGSLRVEDPWLVLVGTSGFRLGQGGWIGHRVGPMRSPDIHLPMIVSDCGPLHVPHLSSSNELPQVLRRLAESKPVVGPQRWSQPENEAVQVETKSDRAQQAITTPRWFYVRDADQQEHLFLKPDDVEDFNDIGRVRSDIIKQLRDGKKEPCGPSGQQG